ncbi:MAG: SRPBCC family protein [Kangiellaceae bacterium]|nr:SRPBCC family protein [Kangiellaceae bacterium]
MKSLKIAIAVFVAIVVVIWGYGLTLSSTYKVQRSIIIEASAEQVYQKISDFEQWRSWGVWFTRDPNMTIKVIVNAAQGGHKITWQSLSQGNGSMTLTEAVANQSLNYLLEFPDMATSSNGRMTIENIDNKVKVTWSDSGDVGSDIVSRYIILFIDGLIGKDFEQGLLQLREIVEGN